MRYFICGFLLALTGCDATMLANRVSCTVAKDQAFYTSMYGQIGVSSLIDQRDSKELCK